MIIHNVCMRIPFLLLLIQSNLQNFTQNPINIVKLVIQNIKNTLYETSLKEVEGEREIINTIEERKKAENKHI